MVMQGFIDRYVSVRWNHVALKIKPCLLPCLQQEDVTLHTDKTHGRTKQVPLFIGLKQNLSCTLVVKKRGTLLQKTHVEDKMCHVLTGHIILTLDYL